MRGPDHRPDLSRRILVVEDDRDHAQALHAVLAAQGYRIDVASSGDAGLDRAGETRPDLILLDVHLPVVDGFSIARQIDADARTRHTPILFVSGVADLTARIRALPIDGVDFLRKPFGVQELLARVERSLNQSGLRKRLRDDAGLDALTGLGNLRQLRERSAVEQLRMDRYGTPLAVVALDLDKLKEINDRHGHAAGNEALTAVGRVLREEIRDTDLAARQGGDEFVVLLPHTGNNEAVAFGERVLTRIGGLRPADFPDLALSASAGVAWFNPSAPEQPSRRRSLPEFLEHADLACYRAKRLGGRRVCSWG